MPVGRLRNGTSGAVSADAPGVIEPVPCSFPTARREQDYPLIRGITSYSCGPRHLPEQTAHPGGPTAWSFRIYPN